ncbi:Frag1/DRAM/Sfk1 family-domain-containing protein [Lipomyces chichibuensis]|uniref:Frag1/DRAM/Sfk1 family-domain-containing protein n=1 Tax=Lipomyces chichibuensis TaxID=1546026 RepID=UPI003343DACE
MPDEKGAYRSRFSILESFRFYWLLPLTSVIAWWAMLIALMTIWAASNYRIYPAEDAGSTVPYVSDIAASGVKPLFIACDAVQGTLFVLALMSERYLRHKGRLERNRYKAEKIMSTFAIIFAVIGQIGLVLLSILDTYRHHHAHVICLGIFVVGIGIAAACSFCEFAMLRKNYYEVHWLRFSYILKLGWVVVAMGLAIAFVVLMGISNPDPGAIVEWTLAYWYGFFGIILMVDLLPASRRSQQRERNGGYIFGLDMAGSNRNLMNDGEVNCGSGTGSLSE